MSFSSVDDSPTPQLLVDYLDGTTRGQWAMKNYVAASFEREADTRPILDVGCGTGADVLLLERRGIQAIGVDTSQAMAQTARDRGVQLLCVADGCLLPFRTGAFGGCRVERVLMHVEDPRAVLHEVTRCLAPGAVVAAFEPDWSSFVVDDEDGMTSCSWINGARHPAIGGRLWDLAEDAGLEVLDQVEERSVWRSLARLDAIVGGAAAAVDRAIAAHRIDEDTAAAWLQRQRARDSRHEFRAQLRKVLVLARSR